MGDFVSEWAGSGLKELRLPSGRQVRLRLPEPRDLIVRGLLPTELVQAVLAEPDATWSDVSDANPELAQKLADSMNLLAADSIRQGRRTDDEEWESITVPIATYLLLPDEDREMIEALVVDNLPAEVADGPEGERATREEAAATEAGYTEFRDGPGRAARRKSSRKVRPAPVDDDRSPAGESGPVPRHRTRRATRKG